MGIHKDTVPNIRSTAFDAFANTYDDDFTNSTLGRLLRPRVWQKLAEHFSPEQHVLELACGTGEDAVWLAEQGVWVTATDGSAEMVEVALAKAERAGVKRRRGEEASRWRGEQVERREDRETSVTIEQVSLQEIANGHFAGKFDGVYSNFGGLNTIGEWRPLAQALTKLVRPGGKVVLVPMGPFCPWEIAWYLVHGQPKEAFRRLRQNVTAKIGNAIIPIWYPSAKQLRTDFAPWFRHRQTESLGLWLPPSYLDHFVNRQPNFFGKLNQFEKATARLTKGWGDHYLIVFERR